MPAAAGEQEQLLRAKEKRLAAESERIAVRRRFVGIKIAYWQAVAAGDHGRAESLAIQARGLADQLYTSRDTN